MAPMSGTISHLLLAVAVFVGGHFGLSSLPLRNRLSKALGSTGFRLLYVAFSAATLAWVIRAYGDAPKTLIWDASAYGLYRLPHILMPFACILVVAGITTRNVTMVGGEKLADDPQPPAGILTITRHPFLWGVALWSFSHLLANGDDAGLVLFGGMLILSLGGMAHIDYRRRVVMGAKWGPVAMSTSAIPFLAVIQKRTHIDWAGIGLLRIALALILYSILIFGHPWFAGVPVFS